MQFKIFRELIQDRSQLERSRLIALSGGQDYAGLINCYEQGGFVPVYVSEYIDYDRYVMMPVSFFAELDDRLQNLRARGQKLLLLGLDGYLSILNYIEQKQLLEQISRYLDGDGAESLVILINYRWPVIDQVLTHPKWRQGLNLLTLDDVPSAPQSFERTFIPKEAVTRFESAHSSLRSYLMKVEQGSVPLDSPAIIGVNYRNGNPFMAQAGHGLSLEIQQLTTFADILRELCSFDAPLSADSQQWVWEHTATTEVMAELQHYFFPVGYKDILLEILRNWANLKTRVEHEIYFYLLTRLVKKESYLSCIMTLVSRHFGDLVPLYLCPPQEIMLRSDAVQLAEERAAAIKYYGQGQSWLAAFIQNNAERPLRQIQPWLNLGDSSELTEYIRRVQNNCAELEEIKGYCPEIAGYLADVSCGDDKIDEYLVAYRRQKLSNHVSAEFVALAQTGLGTMMLDSRQTILNKYKNDEQSFLLVIDALGAEYLPFLVSQANERHLKIAEAKCAQAKLPTSTPFNDVRLEWGTERFYKYDELDNLLHSSYADPQLAFSKELVCLQKDVLDLVQSKLFSYERVIVTADHGASRLAVLAYQQGLCKSFEAPVGVEVEDWRYGVKKVGINLPAADFSTTLNDDKAVIKGYNRFTRSGGPGFECHGGDTVEERVVPILIFERGEFTCLFKQPQKAKIDKKVVQQEQLLEKDDFDI